MVAYDWTCSVGVLERQLAHRVGPRAGATAGYAIGRDQAIGNPGATPDVGALPERLPVRHEGIGSRRDWLQHPVMQRQELPEQRCYRARLCGPACPNTPTPRADFPPPARCQ